MELHEERVKLGFRERFCGRGQWAWNRLLTAMGTALSC